MKSIATGIAALLCASVATVSLALHCPTYDETATEFVKAKWDPKLYQGVWYEHALYDIMQSPSMCKRCSRFIWKYVSPSGFTDQLTASCTAGYQENLTFPGEIVERSILIEDKAFPVWVVDVQVDPKTGEYTSAIQFECIERRGVVLFTGVEFWSRSNVLAPGELEGFYKRAASLGLDVFHAVPKDMLVINHTDCNYPPVA
jgi:hypothetical protein